MNYGWVKLPKAWDKTSGDVELQRLHNPNRNDGKEMKEQKRRRPQSDWDFDADESDPNIVRF